MSVVARTSPSAYDVRDFLTWAADRKHCQRLNIPGPQRRAGAATSPGQRWELISRLLHDDTLDLTDRAAGALLLLFGQHLSRTAVMTTSQITDTGDAVLVRFGQHEIPVPDSLGDILTQLIQRSLRCLANAGSPCSPAAGAPSTTSPPAPAKSATSPAPHSPSPISSTATSHEFL